MNLRIAICDDEQRAAMEIKNLLETYQKERLRPDTFISGEDFLNSEKEYDVLFLDIDMGGMDGIETARRIRLHDKRLKIIYVTSYKEYAGKAFSVHAFGYLLKPVSRERLFRQVEDVIVWMQEESRQIPQQQKQLEFQTAEGYVHLAAEDITYFEYLTRRIYIRGKGKQYEMQGKISEIARRMKCYDFAMPHKSFVVNLYHVKNIKGYEIEMTDGSKIPLSQKQSVRFRETLSLYLANQM